MKKRLNSRVISKMDKLLREEHINMLSVVKMIIKYNVYKFLDENDINDCLKDKIIEVLNSEKTTSHLEIWYGKEYLKSIFIRRQSRNLTGVFGMDILLRNLENLKTDAEIERYLMSFEKTVLDIYISNERVLGVIVATDKRVRK